MAGILIGIFLGFSCAVVQAEQLNFRFINPRFGGSPLNYAWLLESASIQNDNEVDLLDEFEDNLNRSILNTLASQIVRSAFGDFGDELQPGNYSIGKYNINVSTGSNIQVDIVDQTNGSSTSVSVPYY